MMITIMNRDAIIISNNWYDMMNTSCEVIIKHYIILAYSTLSCWLTVGVG